MALESLTLVHPTDATRNITLNGTKWGLEEIDLGNPSRREDLITSIDASGAFPARVSTREIREVTARLRLLDATTVNGALDSIGTLERLLNEAEDFASSDPTDPVLDMVRLVYKPAGSTYAFSLIVMAAEITDIPKTLNGDDAGWFIKRPVVTIRAICDPFAYGADVTSPSRTVFLDATTGGTNYADSYRVPASGGIVGDVSPWVRVRIKDVASVVRNKLVIGVRQDEANQTAVITPGSMTAIAGTLASGVMSGDFTDWQTLASIPQQTRTGSFRVLLSDVISAANKTGSARLVVAEVGGSRRVGPTVTLNDSGRYELDLGEVSVGAAWNGWLETKGSVQITGGITLIPTDSYVEATGAAAGKQLVGAVTIADSLQTTSTSINGRTFTTGSGSWSNTSGSWPVSSTGWARRTAVSMTSSAVALAHTTNFLNLDLRFRTRTTGLGTVTLGSVNTGAVLRYKDADTYVVAGWQAVADAIGVAARPVIIKRTGSGSLTQFIWTGETETIAYGNDPFDWQVQTTADGRWYLSVESESRGRQEAFGQDADLISGGAVGDSAASRVGLWDFHSGSGASTRDISNFQASALAGVTTPPIPSGATLTLAGPKMLSANNADLPYIGSSGIQLKPGAANNVTVFARRVNGIASSTTTKSDALDVDIDGWPRFLSVPHS